MKSIKILGLALCAVLATSAFAAASALALPEYSKTKVKFTSTSGESILKTGGTTVTCKKDTDTGEITTSTESTSKVTFTECTGPFGASCNSPGAKSGVIETASLTSKLGYINKSKKEVGELLKPTSGTNFVTIECFGIKSETTGSVIGRITPVNTKSTKSTLSFKESGGKQEVTKFEGESGTNTLKAFGEEATETSTDEITTAEALEIKA
ncbi:MAG TPA: hypothetical protein VKV16_02155 [Solirubrobacteraceae bacterium]|nr:hypothetical protein [Solirubrobacteraceae bacterium]